MPRMYTYGLVRMFEDSSSRNSQTVQSYKLRPKERNQNACGMLGSIMVSLKSLSLSYTQPRTSTCVHVRSQRNSNVHRKYKMWIQPWNKTYAYSNIGILKLEYPSQEYSTCTTVYVNFFCKSYVRQRKEKFHRFKPIK